jgi:hypothetical protein
VVAQIIPDSVPCQKPPHDGRQRTTASPEQKVEVIGNQCPGIASCLTPAQDRSQTVKEIVPIPITEKDLLSSNSTPDDMMQSPRGIYPALSRHRGFLSYSIQKANNNIMYVPYVPYDSLSFLSREAVYGPKPYSVP